ncbi:MAG: DUF1080 domain-containing protein [Bryobacteraceae bacterium]|nr:DUF1080 domain-containing protein [Bryobacteraceae bacterium]
MAQLPPKQAGEGWVQLFDGETLFGWTAEGKSQWQVKDGALRPADNTDTGWLRHNARFADFTLYVEFRVPKPDTNSGLFLRSAKEGAPETTGYELQIWDQRPTFKTGSLVNHLEAKRSKLKTNFWHTYEVTMLGDRITVKLDGKTVLDGRDAKSRSGYIGLQYNKDNPCEFRNVRVRPLGLESTFNGKDLSGWREVKTPNAKEPPVWSVKDGMLNVVKGAGQLETEGTWANFILQLDIRPNSQDPNRHPNSGVFFRGMPGQFWSGYESQIRNEYKDDPSKPVDFGTGGIYRNQPARRIVAKDNEFFTKTILADGRRLMVWVNGYLVSDWEDPNPEGTNVRQKQAVLAPGPISLQAHDPTTNLDFRNLRIVALP